MNVLPLDIGSGVRVSEAEELIRLAKGCIVLELGAYTGYSTIALSRSARVVHSVDWHQGDDHAGYANSLPNYLENLSLHDCQNVITHLGRFQDVLPPFREGAFDGCFLDGQHDAESVRYDIALLHPLVRSGGWVAFHDYGVLVTGFGVAEAVDEYAARLGAELHHVDTLAWLVKP